jgi:hypothetical protein
MEPTASGKKQTSHRRESERAGKSPEVKWHLEGETGGGER